MRANQNEQPDIGEVTTLNDRQLDEWLSRYSDEEKDDIAQMWQAYAGERYKNVIVAEEEDGESG